MRPWLLVTSLLLTIGQFAASDGVLARSFPPNVAGRPNMTGGLPPTSGQCWDTRLPPSAG
jgi:hypothetical protein